MGVIDVGAWPPSTSEDPARVTIVDSLSETYIRTMPLWLLPAMFWNVRLPTTCFVYAAKMWFYEISG